MVSFCSVFLLILLIGKRLQAPLARVSIVIGQVRSWTENRTSLWCLVSFRPSLLLGSPALRLQRSKEGGNIYFGFWIQMFHSMVSWLHCNELIKRQNIWQRHTHLSRLITSLWLEGNDTMLESWRGVRFSSKETMPFNQTLFWPLHNAISYETINRSIHKLGQCLHDPLSKSPTSEHRIRDQTLNTWTHNSKQKDKSLWTQLVECLPSV